MDVTMFLPGDYSPITKRLNKDGIIRVEETAKSISGLIGFNDNVCLVSSPRCWEVQTAEIVKETLISCKITCPEVQILNWLYELEAGEICVDNKAVGDFLKSMGDVYDHIVVVASKPHVESWPVLITGNHNLKRLGYGKAVTVSNDVYIY